MLIYNCRSFPNDRRRNKKRKAKCKKNQNQGLEAVFEPANENAEELPLKREQLFNFLKFPLAHIELQSNASQFAVFSTIRSTVLKVATRRLFFQNLSQLPADNENLQSCCLLCTAACLSGNHVECACHASAIGGRSLNNGEADKLEQHESSNSDLETDSDEFDEKEMKTLHIPLIVGAGLRSLFELILEARHVQPMLCSKALKALLDIIQGQEPESFKQEPEELINPLYDLLLELSSMPYSNEAESEWSAMACSSLIGLCIARGDTGRILKAVTAMLMSPKPLLLQNIQMPVVLSMLQRTVISAALSKPHCPDFHTKGVPKTSLIDEVCTFNLF